MIFIPCYYKISNAVMKSQKMLKKYILTSVWSVQHPKAGQNIQQTK